jgi:hypothetical protein
MMSNSDVETAGDADPLLGQVLSDRYRVVRKVKERTGGGGVYFAEHLQVERPVTVEVLQPDHGRPAAIDQFLEEARTVARIGHENVVDIFNGGRAAGGSVFLAMEYLEGTALSELLKTDGPMTWDRAQGILLQITAALSAVHRHGIVHRDLQPENIVLITRNGRRDFVKLLDFGVARVTGGDATDQGSFTGAPEYMAPEQAQAGPVDHRADIYSLGCVVYHMVTGRPPFPTDSSDSILDLLSKHQNETPVPPSSLRPAGTLPADLDVVILRALEKDPALRWPDMAAFGDAIARCRLTRRQSVRVEALTFAELSGRTDTFEADARRRGRKWSVLSVAAAVILAIIGFRIVTKAPGHVQISTVPADATLTFNGLPVAAGSPVVLDAAPGRYALVVSRPGYVTAQRTINVSARGTVTVPVELAPAPAAVPAPAAALPPSIADPTVAAPGDGVIPAEPAAAPAPAPAPAP